MYQDGVRINEPFGDTVNWDAIPEAAIASINVIPGSNPLFGLNTASRGDIYYAHATHELVEGDLLERCFEIYRRVRERFA